MRKNFPGMRTGRRSPPVHRGRGPRSGEGVQKAGVNKRTEQITLLHIFSAPPPRQRRYSPYEQGESAVRSAYSSACVLVFLTAKYD